MSESLSPVPAAAAATLEKVAAPAIAFIKTKPWHQSLTVQGGMVTAAAAAVAAYAPGVLGAFHLPADLVNEITQGGAGLLALIGSGMTILGRLRLGGLH